jgi:uncharacterized protein
MQITASQLYDYISCPHRVSLDAHRGRAGRDEVSPFVRLLWERGASFEGEVLTALGDSAVRVPSSDGDRIAATLAHMDDGAAIILGGRIAAGDLLGEPDVLIRVGNHYMPADVKSGRAEQGDASDAAPKPHYAVQVALYVEVLEQLGRSAGRIAEIWDITGERVRYVLDERRGSRSKETWWSLYEQSRDEVRAILAGELKTLGALAASCGLCHWHTVCRRELQEAGDLTLIPALGRSLQNRMAATVRSITHFAAVDPETLIKGKKTIFQGLSADRLRLFHTRARLLTEPNAAAFLRAPVELPAPPLELFFDIEADPMRDCVYLHGFIERRDRKAATETFTGFFADEPTRGSEREAFAGAIGFMRARPDSSIFYYSKYERTMYRKLQERYPEVCTADDIEALFTSPRSVDLYTDVVTKATEWPTQNHSIKTLAKHLGFAWRDADPSGAASIEWYHRWVETRNVAVRQRILDYNEDDCRATIVLLDGIRAMM